jgi:c-di-GMP-binding flagellar brake protein YcgR
MEKRRNKRRHIIYYLRVFERDTGQLIGQLVDITTSGMKLISEQPIEIGKEFKLRMVLPEKIDRKEEIHFDVKGMWVKRDINPNFFSIGFEFLRIAEEDVGIIQNLIYDYSFRD